MRFLEKEKKEINDILKKTGGGGLFIFHLLGWIIVKLSWVLSRFSSLALFTAMVLIVGDIVTREFLGIRIPGRVEMVGLLGVIILGLSQAYCQLKKGHIAVGVLVNRFSLKMQALVDVFITIFTVVITSMFVWQLGMFALRLKDRGRATGHLEILEWPFVFILATGFIVLLLVLLRDLVKAFTVLISGGGISLKRK